MEWHVRRATIQDVQNIAPRLRDVDIADMKAASGLDPVECLTKAMELPSLGTWVGVYKGQPEIIFGCTYTACPDTGVPWMVCTDVLKDSPREFLKKCRLWIKGFSKQFPLLMNFVSAENSLHIRWLKWCGFEFVQLHDEYGVEKKPFWEFRMKQKEN